MATFTLTDSNYEQVVAATTEIINGYIVRRYVRISNGKPRRVLNVENLRGFGSVDIFVQTKLDSDYHYTGEFEFKINNGAWVLNPEDAEKQLVKYCGAVLCVRELQNTDWNKMPIVYINEED